MNVTIVEILIDRVSSTLSFDKLYEIYMNLLYFRKQRSGTSLSAWISCIVGIFYQLYSWLN